MNYAFTVIEDAANQIQEFLANEELRMRSGVEPYEVSQYYIDKNPDAPFLKSPKALQTEVIKRLRESLIAVRKAQIYAKRVEWLMSGDDGYEAFCLRLEEELAKCKKHNGIE